jgi:hypothetical protein
MADDKEYIAYKDETPSESAKEAKKTPGSKTKLSPIPEKN